MAPGTLSQTSPMAQEVCSVQVVSQCYLNEAYDDSPSAHVSISRDMDKIQGADEIVESIPNGNATGSLHRETAEEDKIDLRFPVVKPYFLKNMPIEVLVTELLQDEGSGGRNILYKIGLEHGGYFWTIFRSYAQIQALFSSLYYHNKSIPHNQTVVEADLALRQVRRFPTLPEQLAPNSDLETRIAHCRSVENLLTELLDHSLWREHETCRRFLVVSAVSFRDGRVATREKDQEIIVRKLSCSICTLHHNFCNHDNNMCKIFARWKFRYCTLFTTIRQ
ncbi:hypothetical protein RvY_07639 [Ramazzottius varieornatus]|uniref:PX domain-containing protein n=1 Tax=Ramazzottius varieornatus TaxID=947166 RepID=A0A1D1V7X1_RAMVA|nr:hypothetical protein RvY_07639 [Ramazzottius varieornatus]